MVFVDKSESRKKVEALVVLVGGSFIVFALGTLGWRVLTQEKALIAERQRMRLEVEAAETAKRLRSAAPRAGPVRLIWQDGRLVQVEGATLVWWPDAAPGPEAPVEAFQEGEEIEFGSGGPQRALAVYQRLGNQGGEAVRAGSLMREARCFRKLGRNEDAGRVFASLADCRNAWVAGLPAELLAHLELGRREELDRLLRQGAYRMDRPSFELLAEGGSIPTEERFWAEAADALLARVHNNRAGRDLLRIQGRALTAVWSGGRAVLAVEDLLPPAANWRLEDDRGDTVWGALGRSPELSVYLSSSETGLPWGLRAAIPNADGELLVADKRLRVWGAALGLLLLGTLTAGTQAARLLYREIALARRQSEFVAAVSHEFRTPLAAMTHLTELLQQDVVEEHRKSLYYSALATEARRLKTLVETLLEFGRMEAGALAFRKEVIGAGELVQGIVEEFKAGPSSRVIDFELDSVAKVEVDRLAVGRAVMNLLDNADKYSPPSEPVKVHVGRNGGCVRIVVEDLGPGMPQDEQAAIFRKFVRGSAAKACNVSGTGIGLALVDGIIKAHGGRMELDSKQGRGSRFSIVLPEVQA